MRTVPARSGGTEKARTHRESGPSPVAAPAASVVAMPEKFATVEDYIASFPPETRAILEMVRDAIRSQVPGAEEKVRYDMPAVILSGRYAIHYAAWKKHLGIYPVSTAPEELERQIAPFRSGKDSVNFPYSAPIPYELIERIAAFLAEKHGG